MGSLLEDLPTLSSLTNLYSLCCERTKLWKEDCFCTQPYMLQWTRLSIMLGVVVHTWNLSTWEFEAGGLPWVQPGLHHKIISNERGWGQRWRGSVFKWNHWVSKPRLIYLTFHKSSRSRTKTHNEHRPKLTCYSDLSISEEVVTLSKWLVSICAFRDYLCFNLFSLFLCVWGGVSDYQCKESDIPRALC